MSRALPLALGVVVAAGLAGCGSSRPAAAVHGPAAPSPLLGYVDTPRKTTLARLRPDTLRPSGRRIDVGLEGCASREGGTSCWIPAPWSYSPDGTRLAIARDTESLADALRIVDVAGMRVGTDIPVSGGAVGLVAWPRPERLLAVQELCCRQQELDQLLVVNLAAGRVIARRPLGGTVMRVARSPRGLVLLLAPARRVGPARLAIVDSDGHVRFAALSRIQAGEQLLDSHTFRMRQSIPGLAVDGRRALVVAPGYVAAVDLARLGVSYHELTRRVSLLGRLRDWLDPAAYAKEISGPVRTATWLGGGLLAVTGSDGQPGRPDGAEPAGLSLVDTRDWSVRTIDPDTTDVRAAGGLLLATGETGLTTYGRDGSRRYRRFNGRQAWVRSVYRNRAYIDVGTSSRRIVDLATGATRRAPATARPLLGRASSWWDDG